uniref:uncharacterized protein LOC128930349 n=1 Tax=Callithrix jacchus TaxID=9483 RepID=UPI0023DD62B0|nr:uncharacterized protein LOC128930349 [Callithrix jacchus]
MRACLSRSVGAVASPSGPAAAGERGAGTLPAFESSSGCAAAAFGGRGLTVAQAGARWPDLGSCSLDLPSSRDPAAPASSVAGTAGAPRPATGVCVCGGGVRSCPGSLLRGPRAPPRSWRRPCFPDSLRCLRRAGPAPHWVRAGGRRGSQARTAEAAPSSPVCPH